MLLGKQSLFIENHIKPIKYNLVPVCRVEPSGTYCNRVDAVNIETILLRIRWLIDWNAFGRKCVRPNRGTIPASAWKNWERSRKVSVMVSDVLAGIRTEHLLNVQAVTAKPTRSVTEESYKDMLKGPARSVPRVTASTVPFKEDFTHQR
jgi:hypothetical protein